MSTRSRDDGGQNNLFQSKAKLILRKAQLGDLDWFIKYTCDAIVESPHPITFVVDGIGCTPLYRASIGGHIPLMKWLLDKGADPDFRFD